MNYKLVAIDMDGTLLTPNLEISKKTIETARKVIDKRVIITLSTGRMYLAALPFAKTLQLDVPIITCNGALIKCAKTGKEYYQKIIPSFYTEQIAEYCNNNRLSLSVYNDDDIFIKDNKNLHIHQQMDMVEPQITEDFNIESDDTVIKLLISNSNKFDLEYHAQKLYESYKDDLTFYFSFPYFFEIVHKDANKKNALEFLAKKFDIKREEIISIGDNYNDMEMIQYAGLGIAMGNAPEYIKEAADFVTHSNDEDGVNYVFEKFLL